jgi:hypothetical protein
MDETKLGNGIDKLLQDATNLHNEWSKVKKDYCTVVERIGKLEAKLGIYEYMLKDDIEVLYADKWVKGVYLRNTGEDRLSHYVFILSDGTTDYFNDDQIRFPEHTDIVLTR